MLICLESSRPISVISDHYSIFSVHKSPDRITNTQYRIKRNFCEKNKSFKKSLKKEGWAGIYKYVSVLTTGIFPFQQPIENIF